MKIILRTTALVAAAAILLISIAPNIALATDAPHHYAESVLIMDAQTGEVLFERAGFTRRYPASITKIMTALLVLELADDLQERVLMTEYAVDLPHYAGRLGVYAGECMTVLEALYAIMLPSANDVARALAEHFAPSRADFVAQMNTRAAEIGAENTRFINPCGLPGDGQFTTAYDIALIMREAISHPLFVQIIATPYFTVAPNPVHEEPRRMRNSNQMVHPTRDEFNPNTIGGKTGFTNAAQHTLVSYAEYDGREVIISVLFASPRSAIFSDTTALINYIFGFAPPEPPPEEPPEVAESPEESPPSEEISESPPASEETENPETSDADEESVFAEESAPSEESEYPPASEESEESDPPYEPEYEFFKDAPELYEPPECQEYCLADEREVLGGMYFIHMPSPAAPEPPPVSESLPPAPPEHLSTTEAALVATISLGTAATALLALFLLRKKI
ncbi:MAG: D-alanyl-D-alanine carboxypeptidase [Defluviitaleaceae bacterium]|nr:D-alanyl-D-alanine carboxypeptidase [Defluviitaleaceae bacterium]